MAFWNRFFSSAGSQALGYTFGMTAAPALMPQVQAIINDAWALNPDHPMPFYLAAQIAAEDRSMEDFMRVQGAQQGIKYDKMDQLLHMIRTGPGLAFGFDLWRRDLIDEAGFERVMWEEKLEETFHAPLKALRHVLLSPAELAMMRQQGFIDRARQLVESERQGVTNERADLLFEISGLPPGIETAFEMWRRGVIGRPTFDQIVREGHTKTKYTDELAALFFNLVPTATLVSLRLKGWIDDGEYHSRMRAHGYDADAATDMFHALGRPATALQMVKGFRRGGRIPGVAPTEEAHVRTAVIQSDIRPEDAELIYAQRETMPSAFVLRALTQGGAFTRQEAADILYQNAWRRDIADAAAASWTTGTGTTSKGLTVSDLATEYEGLFLTRASYIAGLKELGFNDSQANEKADAVDARRTRTARGQLVDRIHSQYVNHRISRDRALGALTQANVPARVRNLLMPDWDLERDLTADALTPAQIKKAYRRLTMTRDVAVDRLEAKGYEAADASEYLDQ